MCSCSSCSPIAWMIKQTIWILKSVFFSSSFFFVATFVFPLGFKTQNIAIEKGSVSPRGYSTASPPTSSTALPAVLPAAALPPPQKLLSVPAVAAPTVGAYGYCLRFLMLLFYYCIYFAFCFFVLLLVCVYILLLFCFLFSLFFSLFCFFVDWFTILFFYSTKFLS